MTRRNLARAAAAAVVAAAVAPSAATAQLTGPSTTTGPYVLPVAGGVATTSVLSVGDSIGGYKMVGIPDGLGAFQGTGSDFRLFMNHELGSAQGIVRAHGQKGAFVSDWKINRNTYAVTSGADLIDPGVKFWNYVASDFTGPDSAFNRFCSGSLSDRGQLYNAVSGNGYSGRLYFANEEGGDESRTFAVDETGATWQLPRLGRFSSENTLAARTRSDTTLVQGQEDAGTGQLWTYVGTKTNTGDPFEKAGLNNGTLNVIDTVDESVSTDAQFRATYGRNVAVEVDLATVNWNQSGAAQNAEGATNGLTLNRIEDGSWDPSHPDDFYFVTTEGGGTTPAPGATNTRDGGGLWRLRYHDIENPAAGATLTLLLDGTEAPYLNKPDNMTIDTHGNLLIQEDPGGNDGVARIVAYQIATGRRAVLATFDPAKFTPGSASFITNDEESSGIIDGIDTTGDGSFIFDAQVHKAIAAPDTDGLVQMGQLLVLDVADWGTVYGPAGPAGPAGPSGPAGPAGPTGPAGADGAGGKDGKAGAAGPAGKDGPTGATGPAGIAGRDGRDAKVTCRLSANRKKVTCRVSLERRNARVHLTRQGKVVASARLVRGVATFTSHKRLRSGAYRLVSGGKATAVRVR